MKINYKYINETDMLSEDGWRNVWGLVVEIAVWVVLGSACGNRVWLYLGIFLKFERLHEWMKIFNF
jgi:hypothetical protein